MTEPNRLTAPGEIAARTRVEALFARIDELGPDMLVLPVPGFDQEARDIALDELENLADRHGRGALLDEARRRVRDGLPARTVARHPGYPVGQPLVASGTVEDQVARMMAIEDAVSVAVVEDALDPETIAFLSAPGRRLLRLAPLDPPGDPGPAEIDGRWAGRGEASGGDTTDDAAEGTEGDADDADAEAVTRQQRVALFVLIGLVVLLIAWSSGYPLPVIGVMLLGVALIAWLFA